MAENESPAFRTMADRIEELNQKRKAVAEMGGEQRIETQHGKGKLTARERLGLLVDPDSFQEMYAFAKHRCTSFGMEGKEVAAEGVVTGCAAIDGRLAHVASQDFTSVGGTVGEVHANKIVDMMQGSLKTGSPFVFINDSGGARIQEGIDALGGYARIFYHNTLLSGVVPQISVICGPCAGGAAYSPALTDFIIQTRQAQMFITGPQVIKQITGEEVSAVDLGGPDAHMLNSGNIHFIANDDEHAIQIAKKLLSFLPSNNMEDAPRHDYKDTVTPNHALDSIVPDNPRGGYDMLDVITGIVDYGDFLEVQKGFADNVIIGFGRFTGISVGIVANQPMVKAGCLDVDASDKAARFIRFCNAFNIPLVQLVDVPGFLPGVEQEYGGIIRHGAKMLFAYSAATVPKVTVVVRKAYGGAYIAMCCKDLGADRTAAWPTAEIAVMGAEGAAAVVFRREIEAAEDKEAKRQELVSLYRDTFSTPFMAGGRRMIDDIIHPSETRPYIAGALNALTHKRELRPEKKHGNIPL